MLYKISDKNKIKKATGVYKFLDAQRNVLYVGKARNLKDRIASYEKSYNLDARKKEMVKRVEFVETIIVESEFDALILEAALISKYKPKYNVTLKDDKSYIYIKITNEDFPRVMLSRKVKDDRIFTAGPFQSKRVARDIAYYLRRIFPYCTQSSYFKKPCFYTHLGLCYPCPGKIRKMTKFKQQKYKRLYMKNIKKIKKILKGQGVEIISRLKKEMKDYANIQKFEKAARVKQRYLGLLRLYQKKDAYKKYMLEPDVTILRYEKQTKELLTILKSIFGGLKKLKRIECYDVSNISGKLAAGSMVTFIHGMPDSKFYRKFKIKGEDTPDDQAMIAEVLKRRLKHGKWKFPDLIVVDGGKPQLVAAKKVLRGYRKDIPLLGLSKKEEEIVILKNGKAKRIRLSKGNSALHLIQRLRDEAHRFAHKYHLKLRVNNLLEQSI